MEPARALGPTYWVSGWSELVAEWHPTRNVGVEPHEISHGSGRPIWWKCPHGPDHEWRASPNNRTSGQTGCPFCAGRKVSVTNSLATLRPDLARQWHPTRNGTLTPDRIVAGSTRRIWWACPQARDHQWRISPHGRAGQEGQCPFCLGVRVCKSNSLAVARPRLAAEWHPKKNRDLTARDVVEGSARNVWWRCARRPEHEWRATVANRAVRRSGCPFCAGRKASADHCLAVAYPAIAAEWHPTRNGPLTPDLVTPRAARNAWWLCAMGHEWRARVGSRTRRRTPCPVCSRKGPARVPVVAPPIRRATVPPTLTRELREEHRRIEQVLVLLLADPNVGDEVLSPFVVHLSGHLRDDATVLYPALELALHRPLTAQYELHGRLMSLVSALSVLPPPRAGRLRQLCAAFQEHCRFEEAVALPAVESVMAPRSFEALGQRLRAARAARLAELPGAATRGGNSSSSPIGATRRITKT